MEVRALGRIRQVLQSIDRFAGGDPNQQIALSEQLEQIEAWGSAPYQEVVRSGRYFHVNTATAVASVVALPTTAVTLALYNNEPDGGRSYVITGAWALYTVNSATIPHCGIIGLLGLVRETAPTDAALTIIQHSGLGGKDTRARTIVGGTALPATTGIAANWFPLNTSVNAAVTSLPGFQQVADVQGKIIVPPGRYFALHTLASAITSSAQMGVEWYEKQLTLG